MHDLKRNLSHWVAEAARGAVLLVTNHNKPVAYLTSADLRHLHLGRHFGKGKKLRPVLKRHTRGRYLEMLGQDREERF